MNLINNRNKRNTCGIPLSSTCVGYEGAFAGILKDEKFDCDVNVDDVIERLSLIIEKLKKDLEDTKSKININS